MTSVNYNIAELVNDLINGIITFVTTLINTVVSYAPVLAEVMVAGLLIYGILRFARRATRSLSGIVSGFGLF